MNEDGVTDFDWSWHARGIPGCKYEDEPWPWDDGDCDCAEGNATLAVHDEEASGE